MIVREVMKDESILDNFDYFNDTKDTLAWLRGIIAFGGPRAEKAQKIYDRLENDDNEYWKKRFK